MIGFLVTYSDHSKFIVFASDIHDALSKASVKEVGNVVIIAIDVTPYNCL